MAAPLYLHHNTTAALAPQVFEAMRAGSPDASEYLALNTSRPIRCGLS
jgi:hypothetical protein